MDRLRILFICIGNMCRSPMAEAIARGAGGDRVQTYSAGLAPTGRVAEHALTALTELGYSTNGLSSKGLADVPLHDMDAIVSLAGPQALQLLPRNLGARLEPWSVSDPLGEDEDAFFATAQFIEKKVKALLDDLLDDRGLLGS